MIIQDTSVIFLAFHPFSFSLHNFVGFINNFLGLLNVEKQYKVEEYYKQQERLLEGFTEMETMTEEGCLPGSLTEVGSKCLYSYSFY